MTLQLEIKKSNKLHQSILRMEDQINSSIKNIAEKVKLGGKIFLCGNGGSAADAQHLAAEFLVRLKPKNNRKPIPAISLALDTSTITACSNDYSFEDIFSRNLEALGSKKDILIGITTSGNSKNVIKAFKYANKNKIFTIGFLGNNGGKIKKYCDIGLILKSKDTARVQECHIFLGHYIFQEVEKKLIK
ncbi:SIS domain-containing protein [Candidatus Pelagibacter bacterium nBUS_44]|uniref:D-sedoheptulose-7-phosphate isomerase n=1 Tax=Candidatus Pelagibacter bacterium nBUS_44 TaxID=3374195 RepID=UPI003EBA2CE3